jgi:hypothetical protein
MNTKHIVAAGEMTIAAISDPIIGSIDASIELNKLNANEQTIIFQRILVQYTEMRRILCRIAFVPRVPWSRNE